jgi:hypothetical protein
MGWLSRIVGEPGPKMVCVAVAPNEPQAELILSMLRAAEIPATSMGQSVKPVLGHPGPRDILVPEHLELDARSVIQPLLDDIAGDKPDGDA